jgi:hypothetical protein
MDALSNPNFPDSGPWHSVGGINVAHVYSGAVFAPLLGAEGSMLMTMSGHNQYNDNAVYRYDVASQRWTPLTKPYGSLQVPFKSGITGFSELLGDRATTWYSDDTYAEYFTDGTRKATVMGQPAAFQSYDSSVYLPPGFGGAGAKGALLTTVRVARAPNGQFGGAQAHILDLAAAETDPTVGWTRWGNTFTGGGGQGSACLAKARRKVYLLSGPSGSSVFVREYDLDTRGIINRPVVGGSGFIGHGLGDNMRYSEARDCLFVAGFGAPWYPRFGIQVIDIASGKVYLPTITGRVPPSAGGGEWVEEHAAFYYYPGSGNDLFKITLPASDPKTNAWTCTTITLVGTPTSQVITAHGSRLRWAPAASCFIWHPGNSDFVQAFRLP